MSDQSTLPVLTLDFDQEQIEALRKIAEDFKSLRFTAPSGASTLPDTPPDLSENTPPNPGSGGSGGVQRQRNDEEQRAEDRRNRNDRRKLSTFRAINRELSRTNQALNTLFETSVKWGAAIGAIAIAGPLGYGSIASRVSEQVRTAQGYNISPGTLQAANAAYGPYFGDANNAFSQLSAAQFDPSNPLYSGLLAIGLNPQDNPTENYPALLERVSELVESYEDEGVALQYINSLGLGGVITPATVNQLVANRENLPELRERYESAIARNDDRLDPTVTAGYQAVSSNLAMNADDVTNSFLRAIARLQGPITDLSDELADLITNFLEGPNGEAVFDSLAEGLQQLANWLGSDEFQQDLRDFGEDISEAARGLREFVAWLAEIFGQDPGELAAWGAGGAAALGLLGAGGVRGAVRAGGSLATTAIRATGGLLRISPLTALPSLFVPTNDTPDTAGEFRAAGVRPWWEVNPPRFDENGNFDPTSTQDQSPGADYSEWLPTGEGALTRGLRNNNPGNLRYAGQRGATRDADGFAVFPDMASGVAALDKQIDLYLRRGRDTLAEIIQTYAPPAENDTEAYTRYVERETGIDQNTEIDRRDVASVSRIVRAIIDYENGQQGRNIPTREIDNAIGRRRGLPVVPAHDPLAIEIRQQPGADYRAQVQSQTGRSY